jgi:hypothetical protein
MFENDTMKNLKRTVRKFGKPKGHRKGVYGKDFLDYIEARIYIYLPCYLWVLENKVQTIIERLKIASKEQDIVLLDYATNCDVLDPRKPLSHAYLVKSFVEGNYPTPLILETQLKEIKLSYTNPYVNEKIKKKPNEECPNYPKVPVSEIIRLIDNVAMTSNEIKLKLNLQIKTSFLTRFLKKSIEIETIHDKPLKFRKKLIVQKSLFN